MNSLTDPQLLRDYSERHSETAFAELVRRHVDFVYSAALRMVRDAHLAEDVTQGVFVALAQNARQLTDRPVLSGWLHRTTQNLAANVVRSDVRRRAREQEAVAMNELFATEPDALSRRSETQADAWEHIAPHLDAALGELSESDRDALLLRYFERKSAREMAQSLGTSEDAAQKRVSRAVERLRELFAKRGVTVGASGLVVAITANAVHAAPVGLLATISAAATLAEATISTTATVTSTQAIAMTALQKTLITVTVAAAIGTGIYEARRASTLRTQVHSLQQQQAPLTEQIQQLTGARDDATRQLAALRSDNERLNRNNAELFKLRGEVTGLRREAAKANSLETDLAKLRNATDEQIPPGASQLIIHNPYLAREAWSDKGTDSPYHAFETMLWAGMTGNRQRLAEVTIPGENSLLPIEHPPIRRVKGVQIVTVSGDRDRTQVGAIVEDEFYGGGLDKPPGTVQLMRFWYLVQTNGEWKITGEKIIW